MATKPFGIIRDDGSVDKKLEPKIPDAQLKKYYEWMILARVLDDRMITLQRQGRVGFYIGLRGEEAAILGSTAALKKGDPILPCYREHITVLYRGLSLESFMDQMFGNDEDLIKGRQMSCHWAYKKGNVYSVSSPVGTQIAQAAGVGMAINIKQDKNVAMVFFGDGATSEGDFHVGMNFAGVYKAPVIFLCRNNQYAISIPFDQQTASGSVAVKAQAYGVKGVQVAGNDFLAMYKATQDAAKRARAGQGATLIEACSYRLGAHSTSDDPRAYRKDSELKKHEKNDPLLVFERYLKKKKLWTKTWGEKVRAGHDKKVIAAIKAAEKKGPPTLDSMAEDVFKDIPWHIQEQMNDLHEYLEPLGGYMPKHH